MHSNVLKISTPTLQILGIHSMYEILSQYRGALSPPVFVWLVVLNEIYTYERCYATHKHKQTCVTSENNNTTADSNDEHVRPTA